MLSFYFISLTLLYLLCVCFIHLSEYWGEMGHFRVEMGKNVLGIESDIAWATPGYYTVMNEVKCGEGGEGCSSGHHKHKRHIPEYYVDPSEKLMPYGDAR